MGGKRALNNQLDLFDAANRREEGETRALIDRLIADTRLYASSEALKALLAFVAKLRHVAPFNAMLLHIQKPGVSFALTAADWLARFGVRPKADARPLLVLRSFGPVDFVYDILDMEDAPALDVAAAFPAAGAVPPEWTKNAAARLSRERIALRWFDRGDNHAGYAHMTRQSKDDKTLCDFEIVVNRNHKPATAFVTIMHELAHLFLGHCGGDPKRQVKDRRTNDAVRCEVEAETVAYVIAKRSDVSPRSESYLDAYQGAFADLDLHTVMKAANAIEHLLGLPLGLDRRP